MVDNACRTRLALSLIFIRLELRELFWRDGPQTQPSFHNHFSPQLRPNCISGLNCSGFLQAMAFSRAAALRSCFRSARPTVARPQLFRQVARRGYASGGHEHAKAGGDAVWAAGAVAVTVPTCWYLLSNAPDTSHGHDDHGDSHGSAHSEEHEEESKDEEEGEKSEGEGEGEKSDDADGKEEDNEKSEDSDSEDEKKDDTPDTSDDEGGDDDKNTKSAKPDAKGGIKKRIESKNARKAGDTGDEAATSKPAGSTNTQSGKQEGLSNTDTKHSTDIANDPSKSSKGDGTPETGKAKGTVSPKRPQPEKEKK